MAKKWAVLSLGVLGAAMAAWLGASAIAGQRFESTLTALKDAPRAPGGSFHLSRLTHERGWFTSKGQAEVTFQPGCAAEASADHAFVMKVDYSASHLILPSSLARFEWTATPIGDAADVIKAMFGSGISLSGTGAVALGGAVRTDMAMPELTLQRADGLFQMSASKGFLTVNGDSLAMGWKLEHVTGRGEGSALEAKNLALDLDLKNRHLGTGSTRFGIEQLSFGGGTIEGLAVKSEASERGDRLDMTVSPSARRVKAKGMDLSDLELEFAVRDLETHSVETLSKVFEASCGMKSPTADEAALFKDAVAKLMTRGLSIGISKLHGKTADGSVDGRMVLELVPAAGGRPSLLTQVRSNGQIHVEGTLVPEAQRDAAVASGFAVAKGTGLSAAYDFAGGVLKVNDQPRDAGPILEALKAADARWSELQATWGAASH